MPMTMKLPMTNMQVSVPMREAMSIVRDYWSASYGPMLTAQLIDTLMANALKEFIETERQMPDYIKERLNKPIKEMTNWPTPLT